MLLVVPSLIKCLIFLDKFATLYPAKTKATAKTCNHNCDMCHKKFSHLKNLKFHKKTHHHQHNMVGDSHEVS